MVCMKKAKSLEQAYQYFQPEALPPGDPWYVVAPTRKRQLRELRAQIRLAVAQDTIFLSGHVGSGKSTELARLTAEPTTLEQFFVVDFRFEESEWAHIDSRQVLFRMAAAIYEKGHSEKRLDPKAHWEKHLRDLDRVLYGDSGISVKEVGTTVEWNFFFAKLRQELKFSENRRKRFRDFGETELTMLRELVAELASDLQNQLAAHQEPARLLVVVDDLDKVRNEAQQAELFDTNLSVLLSSEFTTLMTLPASVLFRGTGAAIRQRVTHLRPIGVLKQSHAKRPEDAAVTACFEWFRAVVAARVEPGLFTQKAVDAAALHSGGVARDFIHLLRQAALSAIVDGLDKVDADVMATAINKSSVEMSYGLYPNDLVALTGVRKRHDLPDKGTSTYLDRSLVLEYNGEKLWFEVNPLLWKKLDDVDGD